MPVTIIGNKYSGSLTSTATFTVTNTSANFISADFNVPRIVGLWTSAGVYRGCAWIRRWVNSTQLELESEFIDSEGLTVLQAVGNVYQISKNFADCVTAGLAVTNKTVTLTDSLVFGTAGSSNSLCFYDESCLILSNINALAFEFKGGLSIFGHLINYAQEAYNGSCSLMISGTGNRDDQFVISNQSAKVWWMGGSIFCTHPGSRLIGGGFSSGTPAEWQKYWGVSVNADVMSPGAAAWSSNASKQFLSNIISSVSSQYAINLRWTNGVVDGGVFKLSGGVALAVFGSDASGAYNIGASPGEFLKVLDNGIGGQPALWRSDGGANQTVNYTNVLCSNRKHGQGLNPGSNANGNCTGIFRFSGLFTGVVNGSLALAKNNNLRQTIQDSTIAVNNSAVLTIEEARVVGHTETVTENTWAYGVYLYGYNLESGAFSTFNESLGVVGNAKKVSFGGFVGQIIDASISQVSSTIVAAYTTLSTFDHLYDYAQYFKALNTSNALIPTVSTQLILSRSGELETPYDVVIDSTAGSVFTINVGTTTITIKPIVNLASGIKNNALKIASGKSLTFAQSGDKRTGKFIAGAGSTIVVAPGSTDLRGCLLAGSTINVISGNATVTVDSIAGITAGANVTLQEPQAITRFYGLPNVANVVLYVKNLTTNSVVFPTLVNGEATVIVTESHSYQIRADAPGYLASEMQVISGATPEFAFNLADYRALYDQGVNIGSQVLFDYATSVVTIRDTTATIRFADMFRTMEDYRATQTAISIDDKQPYPVVLPDRNIFWFPMTDGGQPNPVRIKPHPANTTDPAFLFEAYFEGAADTTYGGFDFTGANGRIIRVRSVVAIAQINGSGGGATVAEVETIVKRETGNVIGALI